MNKKMQPIKLLLLNSLLLILNACSDPTPFIVEIKTDKPESIPFHVNLMHSVPSWESYVPDYDETLLVPVGKKIAFPAGSFSVGSYVTVSYCHPYYSYDEQPFKLEAQPSDKWLNKRVPVINNIINAPSEYHFAVQPKQRGYDLNRRKREWNPGRKEKGMSLYDEEALDDLVRRGASSDISNAIHCVQQIKDKDRNIDIDILEVRQFLENMVDNLDVAVEDKAQLRKTLSNYIEGLI